STMTRPDPLYFTANVLSPIPITAYNPGPMTGAGNNTYLLPSNGAAILIDAGVGHPDHLDAIERALSDSNSTLRAVLVTHDHSDHASGAPAIAHAHPRVRFAKYPRSEPRPYALDWHWLRDG